MMPYFLIFMNESRCEANQREPLHFGMEHGIIDNDQAS